MLCLLELSGNLGGRRKELVGSLMKPTGSVCWELVGKSESLWEPRSNSAWESVGCLYEVWEACGNLVGKHVGEARMAPAIKILPLACWLLYGHNWLKWLLGVHGWVA